MALESSPLCSSSNTKSNVLSNGCKINDDTGVTNQNNSLTRASSQGDVICSNSSPSLEDLNGFHNAIACSLSNSQENRTNLIVNYLPQNMSQEEIRALFASIGEVESCKLIRDKTTGQSLGYGFVNYVHAEHAEKALSTLNGLRLQNKVIKISLARPSSETIKGANLYVCGLPKTMGQPEMEKLFATCGKIITSRILYDTNTGLSKCVGFIRFDQKFEADLAIKRLHGHIPPGAMEPITVKFANSPTNLTTKTLLNPSTSNHSTSSVTDSICLIPSTVYQVRSTTANDRSVLGPMHHLPISRYRFNPLESTSSSRRVASLLPATTPISNGIVFVGSTAPTDNSTYPIYLPTSHPVDTMSSSSHMTPHQQALLMATLANSSVNPRMPTLMSQSTLSTNPFDSSTSNNEATMLNLLAAGYPTITAATPVQPQVGIEFLSNGTPIISSDINVRQHQQQQLIAAALSVQLNALQSHALPGFSASGTPVPNVSAAPLLGVALSNGALVNPVNVATHNNLLAAAAAQANYMNNNLMTGSGAGLVNSNGAQSPNNQQWTLFVNNLPTDADESLLWQLFSSFGTVQSHKVVREASTQKCKGFAFVTMSSYVEAHLAMQHLNGASVGNRVLQVAFKTAGRANHQGNKMDSALMGVSLPLQQQWKT